MSQYLKNPALPVIHPGFKGNLYQHGQFEAGDMTINASYWKVLRWQLSKNPQREEKKRDTFKLNLVKGRSFLQSNEDMIVWLGHASFFIRLNGITLIIDPCLQDLPFIKRKVGLPCAVKEFIGIDYLLLSHGHRDHYDTGTVSQLIDQNPSMELLLPLKLSDLLAGKHRRVQYQEAGWWQQYQVKGIDIVFLPARHWNRRSLFDFNKELWGSFLIRSGQLSIYFGADSGYAPHFKEIRDIAGASDICILPIGAYRPPFMMQEAHLDPYEAVEAFHDLEGKILIPMHYGTYELSDEPVGEPARILQECRQQGRIRGALNMLDVGEICRL